MKQYLPASVSSELQQCKTISPMNEGFKQVERYKNEECGSFQRTNALSPLCCTRGFRTCENWGRSSHKNFGVARGAAGSF